MTHNGTHNFKRVAFICHANIMTCNTGYFSTWLFYQIVSLKKLFDWAHYIFPNISTRKAYSIFLYTGAPKEELGRGVGGLQRGRSRKAFKMVHLPLFSEAPIVKP
jgi:hypothetical protein